MDTVRTIHVEPIGVETEGEVASIQHNNAVLLVRFVRLIEPGAVEANEKADAPVVAAAGVVAVHGLKSRA